LHLSQHIYEENKLMSLLSQDSEYAFQLIYDRYRNRIYQIAMGYLKSPLLAQEVVQDVFLKLWFERGKLNPDQPIESWLYTVAKNNLVNRLKKITREWKAMDGLKLLADRSIDNAAYKIQDSEYNKLLQEAIRELPWQQRKVFQLARYERLTYIQIGEKMNISPLTVKTHMSRALAHIKTYLSVHGDLFLPLFTVLLPFFY